MLPSRTSAVRISKYDLAMSPWDASGGGKVPLLDLIVLDCPDALELAGFYSGLLGWPVEEASNHDWATLRPPGGGLAPDNPDGRPALAFQRIEDWVPPTWPGGSHPQQFHLDFAVDDIDIAQSGILTLGATLHAHQPSQDGGFRVFLDPAGHPFCLVR